ncbi:hypothetical protein BC567DRAFT_225203 [Phyllosticta citribraziliensis]
MVSTGRPPPDANAPLTPVEPISARHHELAARTYTNSTHSRGSSPGVSGAPALVSVYGSAAEELQPSVSAGRRCNGGIGQDQSESAYCPTNAGASIIIFVGVGVD